MTAPRYTKESVQFHRLGYGSTYLPSVNVKHWPNLEADVNWDDFGGRPGAFYDWAVKEFGKDEVYQPAWSVACESAWDNIHEWAAEVFGPTGHDVKVWSEGRQGGWAVVEGLPDVEDWDAVMLAKWRKFERDCKIIAADVAYGMVFHLYYNVWEDVRFELSSDALALIGSP